MTVRDTAIPFPLFLTPLSTLSPFSLLFSGGMVPEARRADSAEAGEGLPETGQPAAEAEGRPRVPLTTTARL